MGAVEFIENGFRLSGKKIKLDAYQKKFLRDDSVFRFVNKSRRVGLTYLISLEALYRALTIPGTQVGIVSVNDRAAKDVMSYVYDALYSHIDVMSKIDPNYVNKVCRVSVKTKSDLRFPNQNSRIMSFPNSPGAVRGPTITDLYLDEFAHYQDDIALYNAILPTITLDREGISSRATFISTPLAKSGTYYEMWAERLNKWKHMSFHVIHWKDCPRLRSKIDIIKRSMDEDQFQREYCNKFVDETLAALPFKDIKACINHDLQDTMEINTRNPVFVGVDFGKVIDSTVIIVVEFGDIVTIKHIKEFKPTKDNPNSYKETTDYILRNYQRWGASKIIVDLQGPGESTIENLRKLGSMVKGENLTTGYKDRIFNHLKNLFFDRKIEIPNNEHLINQLHSIEKKTTSSGQVRYTHPTKGKIKHDDYVWALCLACYAGVSGVAVGGGATFLGGSTFNLKDDEDKLGSGGFTFKY